MKIPSLTPGRLKSMTKALEINRDTYLKNLPIEKIISSLDQVALRWLNPHDPIREQAETLLPQTTGCSREVICEGLNLAFREVRARRLRASLEKLSQFPKPKLSCFIFGGIIPTPMLFDIFLGLLSKSAIIAKCPSREPLFAHLLAQSIHEVDPKLGSCIAVLRWPGGSEDIEKIVFEESDFICAYGNDETILKIRAQVSPKKIFLGFGHKVSFSIIAKDALAAKTSKNLARRAAYDVAMYDQQGCLSPHVIYIESGSEHKVIAWAKKLAKSMERISKKFPPGKLSLGEASQIHQIRGRFQVREKTVCLSSHPRPDWTVIYDSDPNFQQSCLNRVIFVKQIADVADQVKILNRNRGLFQTVGFSSSPEKLKILCKTLKIPFLFPIGYMQRLAFENHIQERIRML